MFSHFGLYWPYAARRAHVKTRSWSLFRHFSRRVRRVIVRQNITVIVFGISRGLLIRMASYVLRLLSFVYVVFTTHAQSTRSEYPGCVCTVNVPPSDCGQRSCPSVDVQLLRSSVVALQEQVVTLASDNRKLADDNRKLADDVGNLRRELSNSNKGTVNLSHALTNTCMHGRTLELARAHTHTHTHTHTPGMLWKSSR